MTKKRKNPAAIDLFCGVGGLTHGLQMAGIPVYAGFDIEEACRFAYEENNNAAFVSKDIREITDKEINDFFPSNSEKIMVGCAPCQTFSTHTQKIADRDQDQKWGLIDEYLKKITAVKPSVISMENVPGLCKFPIFDDFVSSLKKLGYYVSHQIVYCPDYGVAQSRRRLVLLASKYGEIKLVPPTHTKDNYLTVRDVIGGLPSLKEGETHTNDPMHRSASLTDINKKRMKASKPGGNWLDWPENLRLKCHTKATGDTYKSVYARMKWNALAPTMTTQFFNFGTGRFGHPTQDRALSLREGAMIQTFPKSYQFISSGKKIELKTIARMIGNAVPVRLGEVIGISIMKHLKDLKKI